MSSKFESEREGGEKREKKRIIYFHKLIIDIPYNRFYVSARF